jgi:hypothetical protein
VGVRRRAGSVRPCPGVGGDVLGGTAAGVAGPEAKTGAGDEPTGMRAVTWAEFVEAALLREYRRTHGMPMACCRASASRYRLGGGRCRLDCECRGSEPS